MEIYLSKKGFAWKINNLTDFLFNKTEAKYQKIIIFSKKKFQDFSRTFPLFISSIFLYLFKDSSSRTQLVSRTFQDQWLPWILILGWRLCKVTIWLVFWKEHSEKLFPVIWFWINAPISSTQSHVIFSSL